MPHMANCLKRLGKAVRVERLTHRHFDLPAGVRAFQALMHRRFRNCLPAGVRARAS